MKIRFSNYHEETISYINTRTLCNNRMDIKSSNLIVSTNPDYRSDDVYDGQTLEEVVLDVNGENVNINLSDKIISIEYGQIGTIVDIVYDVFSESSDISFVIELCEDESVSLFSPNSLKDVLTDSCYLMGQSDSI